MNNLLFVCLVTLLHWATSAAALRVFPSASSSPVLCEAEKRAISPGTEVRVATVRVDSTDKPFRIATYGKNDIVSGSILAHGRWEPSTLEHLKTALAEREGSVYLDIGANIGYFALYVAALGYKVIAVEASQENANLIRYSLCLNPELKSRIKLHHVALAEKRMRCTMASPEGNVGDMVMDCKEVGRGIDVNNWFRKASEDTVNTVPLDEVVGRDERVDVLKIDTEGFEYHALVGGQKHVLPKIRSVFSEFSPFMLRKQHTDPVAYLELLRKHGLQVYYKGDIVRDYATFTAQFPKDGIDIAAVRDSTRGQKTEVDTLESPKRSQVSFTPWVKRKLGCEFMAESGNGPNNARAWWQRFWEPCIACKDEERIGRIGDGGKWICDPQLVLSKPCSVLSVGSSNEFSFEREMVERFRCTIHIYDHTSNPPTPGVDIPAHLMHLVKFHRTAFDTTVVDEQTTTLSVMVDNLIQAAGTDRVDIFKIDCEGCEFSSFQSPENVQIVQKKVVQMQMEIHFGPNSLQQVSNLWFAMVNKFGMVPFHKEANIDFPMGGDGLALELAFLNQMYVKHEVREVKPPANEKRATT